MKKGKSRQIYNKNITERYINNSFPPTSWIHIYTDAKKSTTEGGGGIYLKSNTEERNLSIPIGKHSTNCKTESEALLAAANLVKEHMKYLQTE